MAIQQQSPAHSTDSIREGRCKTDLQHQKILSLSVASLKAILIVKLKRGRCQADLQVVVVGVLSQPAVEEGPGEVVHGILLAGDGAVDDLSHHVVVQEVVQVALHWEGLEQELLVVLLARRMAHQHTPGGQTPQSQARKSDTVCAVSHNTSARTFSSYAVLAS